MASASFTRDEVILALDVLFSSENGKVTADSDEIKGLSLLLNSLPIHPTENRRVDFRSSTGITAQLMRFRSSCFTGENSQNVGSLFFDIAFEYENRVSELHSKDHCEICKSKPTLCYRNAGQLLQNHLVVAPTFMTYSKKYRTDSFLTVCPTCHAALHRYRPWLTKENCGDVLR